MKIREFLKKYKLIILLATLVFILGFVKIYYGNNPTSTTTEINTIQNNTNENKTGEGNETEVSEAEKIKIKQEALGRKYYQINNEAEQEEFLKTLTEDEINLIPEINQEYCFEYILPYERETFIIKKYLEANLLLVKAKGEDLAKSKNDLKEWLEINECEIGQHVIVWEG